DHATDAHLGELRTGRHDPGVRGDRAALLEPEVARDRIATIRIEVHAGLLDDEHPLAQRDDRVELEGRELCERLIAPPHRTRVPCAAWPRSACSCRRRTAVRAMSP